MRDATCSEVLKLANYLSANMPSIGFCSREKRIFAFNAVCYAAEEICKDDQGDVDFELAFLALSLLTHNNKKFYKALVMTALCYDKLGVGFLNKTANNLVWVFKQRNLT